MKRRTWLLCLLVSLLFAVHGASAQVLKYSFTMSGLQEASPNASPGTGTALVTVDVPAATMRVEASFSDLLGTVSAAHIHCCDFSAPPVTAGVATQTPTFPGFPSGVTLGSYDQTFNMALTSSYRGAFLTANGGTAAGAFSALQGGLASGQAYFNIHSNLFPSGEIRGFAVLVPEPTCAMLALVSLGLPLFTRRFGR
jgi:hypothetical protein